MQKPLLVNIKQEELHSSDGEHYVDNTFSDNGDDEEYEPPNVTPNEEKPDEITETVEVKKQLPSLAEMGINLQDGDRLFECYLCHKTWKTAGNLTYHFTCYHTIGKTSKCHLCGKWIKDASNMVRHLNAHFNLKQFQCNICDSSFARPHSLRLHILAHSEGSTDEFICSKCSAVFITKVQLHIHLKNHVSILGVNLSPNSVEFTTHMQRVLQDVSV